MRTWLLFAPSGLGDDLVGAYSQGVAPGSIIAAFQAATRLRLKGADNPAQGNASGLVRGRGAD